MERKTAIRIAGGCNLPSQLLVYGHQLRDRAWTPCLVTVSTMGPDCLVGGRCSLLDRIQFRLENPAVLSRVLASRIDRRHDSEVIEEPTELNEGRKKAKAN